MAATVLEPSELEAALETPRFVPQLGRAPCAPNSTSWTGAAIACGKGCPLDTGFRNGRLRVGSYAELGVT